MMAILGIFRLLPAWLYAVIAAIGILVSVAVYERATGRSEGAARVHVKWDAAIAAAEAQAESIRLINQSTINKESGQYAVKAAKAQVITRTIIKEVDKYVPNTLPMLPPSFRVYHDAAATGEAPDDSRIADAAPVAPVVVARTVAENYGSCNDEKFRLIALQAIIRKLTETPNETSATK